MYHALNSYECFSFCTHWNIDLCPSFQSYNKYGHDLEMVCAILCAGLYPNVIQCKRRGKRTAFYSKDVGKVDIHPSSVNAGIHLFPLPYMVYSEKVKTTSIYIRDSTNISDYALLLFGGGLTPNKSTGSIEMLGGYLHFSASKSVLQLIQVINFHSWRWWNGLLLSFCFSSCKVKFNLIIKRKLRKKFVLVWHCFFWTEFEGRTRQTIAKENRSTRAWHLCRGQGCGISSHWITAQPKCFSNEPLSNNWSLGLNFMYFFPYCHW